MRPQAHFRGSLLHHPLESADILPREGQHRILPLQPGPDSRAIAALDLRGGEVGADDGALSGQETAVHQLDRKSVV